MTPDPDPDAESRSGTARPDYELLLLRAGATGLDAAERAELSVALGYMDAKIRLIRQRAAENHTGFMQTPIAE